MIRRAIVICFAAAALASGCVSSNKSPTASTPAVNLTGTWTGTLTASGVTGRMTWTLTQTNNSVTGPVLVLLPTGVVLMNGTLTGTLTGSSLIYTIAIGPGGIPLQPACTGQLAGMMTATLGTTSTLSGTYSVASSTCTPPFPATGNLTLTRQ